MRKRPGPGRRLAVLAVAFGLAGSMTQRAAPQAAAFGEGDVTSPVLGRAGQWTGPITPVHEILLLWDDLLDQSATLNVGDFEVKLDGSPLAADSVSFTHAGFFDPDLALTFMPLHLADPVTAPGTLTVSYLPGTIPVMDEAGNAAGMALDVVVDVFEFPSFEASMALVDGSYGRDHVGLLFSDAVAPSTIPPPSAFTVVRNGTPMTPTAVSIYPGFGGRVLDLVLPVGFRSGDVATISYTAPGGGGIENLGGTPAPNLVAADIALFLLARDSVSGGTGAGGGSVTTDAGDPGTTAQDPVATTIDVPGEATVIIDEGASDLPPPTIDWTFIGETVEIDVTPDATPQDPLVIDFAIDASVLATAVATPDTVGIFRDGVLVDPCTGPAGQASPDPCVAARTAVPEPPDPIAYAVIRVLSSHASTWTLAAAPIVWSGLFAPVDDLPTENVVTAGRAVPVVFSLGGDRGLDVFAPGYPLSMRVDCTSGVPLDAIELTVTAGASSLGYDAATDRYSYIWKTAKVWSTAPGGPCRELVLRFGDESEHEAVFRFR